MSWRSWELYVGELRGFWNSHHLNMSQEFWGISWLKSVISALEIQLSLSLFCFLLHEKIWCPRGTSSGLSDSSGNNGPPPQMTAAREKCADIITFGLQKHNNSSQAGNWGGWLPPGKLGRFPEFRDSKLATSQGGEVYYPKPQIIGQRVTWLAHWEK